MFDASEPFICGIILAAGDGRRLQQYIRRLRGDALPKQYFNFIGTRSMLEHTFDRVERLVSSDRLLTVVSKHHLKYVEVRQQLSGRPRSTLVIQPENKETGPGLLLPLMHLYKRYPDSVAAVFPSDHFILEEQRFMSYVHLATQAVTRDPSRIILLAIEAREPETEYGYVLPGKDIKNLAPFKMQRVLRFVEKPDAKVARKLITAGGLWNTMTMVFKVKTLLTLASKICPGLYSSFRRVHEAIGTPDEKRTVGEVYQSLEPMNFSKDVLEKIVENYPESISVLPVRQVYWSDWGSPTRVIQVLRRTGHLTRVGALSESKLMTIWQRQLVKDRETHLDSNPANRTGLAKGIS